ncbi:hypothetical protein [Fundidesulfovibrio agrisoli]|uniref:hypothetical protein n=1 Tax=Fundidesulfovibrio agrisoli TaxID=2922717 RepID=UPI001FAC5A08|nr:hypothetical protein [Fundidesulfovibrio agrisoli]
MSSIFQSMIQKRKHKQEERIAKGLASGKLTTDQASQLESLEDQTDQMTQQALADGQISNEEFKSIMDSYKSNGRQIYQTIHPDQAQNDCQGCAQTGSTATGQTSTQSATQSAAQATDPSAQAAQDAASVADQFYKNLQTLAQNIMTSRESRLDARLQAGQTSGKYSADQLAQLQQLQTQASQSVTGASSDGTITAMEFLQTMQAQNAFSRTLRSFNQGGAQPAAAAAAATTNAASAAYKPVSVSV